MSNIINSLDAIGPLDGRYRKTSKDLAAFFSERALCAYRLKMESEYLIQLSENTSIDVRKFTSKEKTLMRKFHALSVGDAQIIKDIEVKGHNDILATNHDVKAVEYYMKMKLEKSSLSDVVEWIHFGLTSEDTNNIAYALMLSDALEKVIVPILDTLRGALTILVDENKNTPMLARTHGQSASPTTFGKEMKVFESRLTRYTNQLKEFRILVKLSGATGNYNAHVVAYPDIDWIQFTKDFVGFLNADRIVLLEVNPVTTQIESHDTYADLFDIVRKINTILIDFNQDMWRYISDGWLSQKPKAGEVGSSTMPHKVNPIDFENSEGNLGIANALFQHFGNKLPISRLQRDLSDSTVERNFGVAFGHSLVGYNSILKGLLKISVNKEKMMDELNNHPEVISEAIQTVLRVEGVKMPYEALKQLTRGKHIKMKDITLFIDKLDVEESVKKRLKKIQPNNYIGLAAEIANARKNKGSST